MRPPRFKPKKLRPFGEKKRKRRRDEADLQKIFLHRMRETATAPLAIYEESKHDGAGRRARSPWDFEITYKGRTIHFESKSEKGVPRPAQIKAKMEIEAAGGTYVYVRFGENKKLKSDVCLHPMRRKEECSFVQILEYIEIDAVFEYA